MNPRTLAAAKFILARCKQTGDGAVTPMQLMKLTYLAHAWMLGLAGRPLLNEPVEAWQYGPVLPSLYQATKSYGSQPIDDVPAYAYPEEFTEDEKSIMTQVADLYGKFTGIQLSSMTHQPGTPWDQTWKKTGKSSPISNDLIEEFYREKAANTTKAGH